MPAPPDGHDHRESGVPRRDPLSVDPEGARRFARGPRQIDLECV